MLSVYVCVCMCFIDKATDVSVEGAAQTTLLFPLPYQMAENCKSLFFFPQSFLCACFEDLCAFCSVHFRLTAEYNSQDVSLAVLL